MRTTILLVIGSLVPTLLVGQDGEPRALRRRLSIVLESGPALGGPAGRLVSQLRQAGFDDTTPAGCFIWCSGPIEHPSRQAPGGAAGVRLGYHLSQTVALGGGLSFMSLGGSIGFREGSPFGEYIISDWEGQAAWAGLFWRPSPALRLGGGPGWYRLKNPARPNLGKISRVGLMAEAGAELPARRRLFLNLTGRAHLIPSKDVVEKETTLRPAWSHIELLIGIGIRL